MPPRIVLVGQPNVGKSQLFNLLTGSYVTVSNYPGTTVELISGKGVISGKPVEVIDSPGLYSLSALSPEEQVTRLLIFKERPALVIQVADARNLSRMLSLTLELMEADLPLLLVLNMMDEARASGVKIRPDLLAQRLGIPVVPTVLVTGSGLSSLKKAVGKALRLPSAPPSSHAHVLYPPSLESALRRLTTMLKGRYGVSGRTVALSLFQLDPALENLIRQQEGAISRLLLILERGTPPGDLLLLLAVARRQAATRVLHGVFSHAENYSRGGKDYLNSLLLNPVSGGLALALILYFGFYHFVGRFGAGFLVELLERRLFMGYIYLLLNSWGERFLPWPWLKELLVLDFGVLTLGLRYTLTIILPIMATFFFFFSLIEDSGYLPRAAYLVNWLMGKIGLNGKAVIPLTLGLGCGTLAMLATRTLESRKDRLQAALLLSLAIPCSAQLGLIMAVLSPGGLLIWTFVIILSFLAAAVAGRRLIGGEAAPFCLEIPPLRVPRPVVILKKTASRLLWYLREIWVLFIGISVLTWALKSSGLMERLITVIRPLPATLGLPGEAVTIFIYGFLRRDYGVAGLFDLARAGVMDLKQVLVAAVVLTLFLPCAAQLAMLVREQGWRFACLVVLFTALVSWLAGMLLNLALKLPLWERLLSG